MPRAANGLPLGPGGIGAIAGGHEGVVVVGVVVGVVVVAVSVVVVPLGVVVPVVVVAGVVVVVVSGGVVLVRIGLGVVQTGVVTALVDAVPVVVWPPTVVDSPPPPDPPLALACETVGPSCPEAYPSSPASAQTNAKIRCSAKKPLTDRAPLRVRRALIRRPNVA
jgi:hypothetical protein